MPRFVRWIPKRMIGKTWSNGEWLGYEVACVSLKCFELYILFDQCYEKSVFKFWRVSGCSQSSCKKRNYTSCFWLPRKNLHSSTFQPWRHFHFNCQRLNQFDCIDRSIPTWSFISDQSAKSTSTPSSFITRSSLIYDVKRVIEGFLG